MPSTPVQASEEARRLLRGCTLFRALDDETLLQLVARAHRRRFAAGQVIFRIGSPGQSMMAVLTGIVRITVPSPDGKEIVLAELGSGEVLGEMALLDGKDRTADAVAHTNCDLLVLERRDMLLFLERHPGIAIKLLELLCDRLRRADEQIGEIAFLDLPTRLAKALLRVSGVGATPGGGRVAKLSLSQRALANMIGSTRESVNRCLRDWQRRGIVDLDEGWIILRDTAALTEIGGSAGLAAAQRLV